MEEAACRWGRLLQLPQPNLVTRLEDDGGTLGEVSCLRGVGGKRPPQGGVS